MDDSYYGKVPPQIPAAPSGPRKPRWSSHPSGAPRLAPEQRRGERGVEKRRQKRAHQRLTCLLVIDSQRHPAIVRDISPLGMFVQTRARPEPNSVVELIFPADGSRPEIRFEAGVARERVVPPRLQASVPEGVGLEVLDPPAEFRELLARAAAGTEDCEESDEGTGKPLEPTIRVFRVRVKERNKPNSRVLTVRSQSADGARAQALSRAGRGWQVADIQEL